MAVITACGRAHAPGAAKDAGSDGACANDVVCNEPSVPVGCALGAPACVNGVNQCPTVVCPDAGSDAGAAGADAAVDAGEPRLPAEGTAGDAE